MAEYWQEIVALSIVAWASVWVGKKVILFAFRSTLNERLARYLLKKGFVKWAVRLRFQS